MFVLIWAALLLSVRGSNANTGSSVGETWCWDGYCVALSEEELTAEAGLCVVIPCTFSSPLYFKHIVWFKCEPSRPNCGNSDRIFNSNMYGKTVQDGFEGRVSLLESNLSQKNCSIIINDLKESDSGSYQFRVNSHYSGFSFPPRATVSVKGLSQKPTVMIPPLTEGQQTTLTCIAPGLCSGSVPKITWTWKGKGENDSHISGNITHVNTEALSPVTQIHSSALTFHSSAEHHGTEITCKISFTGDATTEETLTLNVSYIKEVRVTGDVSVKEGETLNLTCSVESFPPSLFTWTKSSDENMLNGTETNLQNDTLPDLHNDTETYQQEESGVGLFLISNVTAEDSGQYICTAKHLNSTLKKKVNVTVMYIREPRIAGKTTVGEGGALNLTCSAESFPPSRITWTKLGSNVSLHADTGSASLVIPNVTTEHSGEYVCTAQHLDTAVTVHADVAVTWFPKIHNVSGCEVQSEVLTCVCVSEGIPLPTIEWPLLRNHTEYSVTTAVSNRSVNSTVTLTVKKHGNTAVECVSINENGEVKQNLVIRRNSSDQADQSEKLSQNIFKLEIIIAFLIGVLLTAGICCLAKKCNRKKQETSGNLDETLEMVTGQDDPLMYDGQAEQDDQTRAAERAQNGGVAAENAGRELDSEPKDVEYASIDFSLLKRNCSREAAKKQENTETEYAEIQRGVKRNRDEDGDVLEGKEDEAMTAGDEERKLCVPNEEEGHDEAVYSSVKDVMDAI
ncbi:sialic acid-binding Ig-like lectin 10 [Embiotoca jacksoni]|uniref:sialic acid-binding Ig-like lectin 10 n=1 Tax=Embiotoca jacksoni TaxID=100190 RepID=UPI0037049381